MTSIESPLDRESLNEIIREAIAQTSQEETEGVNRVCGYPYGWGCAEGDVICSEKTISSADRKRNAFCCSVSALSLVVAPISGCVMWFADVSLWINIAIVAFVGIVGGIFSCLSEPRDPRENIGIDIVCNIIACVLIALSYLLVSAILVSIIEGIFWFCAWVF